MRAFRATSFVLVLAAASTVSAALPDGGAPKDAIPQQAVRLVPRPRCRLPLPDKLWFDRHKDFIKPVSYPVLDEYARELKAMPSIKRLRIEGHADDTERNGRDLSLRRAAAARAYLIDKGVERGRLVAVGFGSSCPAALKDNEYYREINRRVDFVVLEQEGTELDPPKCRDAATEEDLHFKAPASSAQPAGPAAP